MGLEVYWLQLAEDKLDSREILPKKASEPFRSQVK